MARRWVRGDKSRSRRPAGRSAGRGVAGTEAPNSRAVGLGGVYEAVIFDSDGVLVRADHLDVHRAGIRRAFAVHGADDPDPDDVEAMTLGVTLPKLRRVADEYGFDPAAFWETRDRLSSAAQLAGLHDGLKRPYDDVDVVRELAVPAAVVSTNQQYTLRFLLERYGLADHVVAAYGRAPTLADLARRKPAPYFLTRALSDLERARGDGHLDPADVLMVGDSESDVRAAHAAGTDAAFVRRPHRSDDDLDVVPDHELADLHELAALLDGE